MYTFPCVVKANENCAPQRTLQTVAPRSLSTGCGNKHPSLPPRPSLPKSPSPHDQTTPSSVKQIVWASRLPQETWVTRFPEKTFTCKNISLIKFKNFRCFTYPLNQQMSCAVLCCTVHYSRNIIAYLLPFSALIVFRYHRDPAFHIPQHPTCTNLLRSWLLHYENFQLQSE